MNSLTSMDAQRGYRHAIEGFVDWYCSEPRLALNRIVVLRYRSHPRIPSALHLAPSTYVSVPCAVLASEAARLRSPQRRFGGWYSPCWRREEVGSAPRQLADCGAGPSTLASIVDLVGKGGHVRTFPVPDWVRTELDDWLGAAAIDRGKLFRRVNKVGRTWGDGMTVEERFGTL